MSLNYVMLGSNDVPKARVFFDAVMPNFGGVMVAEYMPHAFCFELRGGGRVWVATPHNAAAATPGNGNMVGLECSSRAEVQAGHGMALVMGGENEGDPGERPLYGPGFYGAYARDLDGNKMSKPRWTFVVTMASFQVEGRSDAVRNLHSVLFRESTRVLTSRPGTRVPELRGQKWLGCG